jgi:(S)-sulfolactate dehydrogenase
MDESAVDRLRPGFDTLYEPDLVDKPERLRAQLAGAAAMIVRNRTRVTDELLDAAPALKVVGRLGVGLDNIDLEACRARAVEVIPATGANAQAVAEYVICTAMLLLRGAYSASAEVAAGQWPRARLSRGRELAGKMLGLVGFGGIGRVTGGLAQALGMDVVAHDPWIKAEDARAREQGVQLVGLDELLARSDVVSLHVPLTDDTRNLLDRDRLASMKRGAVLVNTARGGIVNESALAGLLRDGHLAGAALDVFEAEPLPAGSVLANVPSLVLTPHIAGLTLESNERVSCMIADKVIEYLARS